jgi:hypothetical protein
MTETCQSQLTESSYHTWENQCSCAYCPHETSDTYEAEHHLISRHLERESWSCAGLDSYSFDPSDTVVPWACCVVDALEPPEESLKTHLEQKHRFGECDKAKRFFDDDRFNEHLSAFHGMHKPTWLFVCWSESPFLEREYSPRLRAVAPSDYYSSQGSKHILGLGKVIADGTSSVRISSTGDACVQCHEEQSQCDGLGPCGRCIWHQREEACAFREPTQHASPSKE